MDESTTTGTLPPDDESWKKDFDSEEARSGARGSFREEARHRFDDVRSSFREFHRDVEDSILSLIPPEVTRHLVNARKELVLAGQRLGDMTIENLERKAARAEEIHAEMKAKREAARNAPPPTP